MSEIRTAGLGAGAHVTSIEGEAKASLMNKVSWGAIFAGIVVAIVVQVLLTMLGIGIGVATIDPATGDSPMASTFSIAAGVWYVVSGIVASFAGGYIAARMSGKTVATTGALHGLTTWAATTLLVIYLLTTAAGGIIGGAFSGIASAVGGLGQTVAQTAAPALSQLNPLDDLEQQIRSTGTDPEALNAAAVSAMRAVVTGDESEKAEARERAATALASARNIPVEQARTDVQTYETRYNEAVQTAKQEAVQAADAAASIVSTGALIAFFSLVLGAVAGWLGGRSGVVHPVYADRVIPARGTL